MILPRLRNLPSREQIGLPAENWTGWSDIYPREYLPCPFGEGHITLPKQGDWHRKHLLPVVFPSRIAEGEWSVCVSYYL